MSGWGVLVWLLLAAAVMLANVWTYNLGVLLLCRLVENIVRMLAGEREWLRWLALPAELHHELWPFAGPGIFISAAACAATRDWTGVGAAVVLAVAWWLTRKWPSDDDRWRRRRRKLLATVQRQGGRLVIMPSPT